MVIALILALYGTFQRHIILLASYLKSHDLSTDSCLKSHDFSTDSCLKSHDFSTDSCLKSHYLSTDSNPQLPDFPTTSYLTYLLLTWIACIVIDGRLSVSILSRHRQKMLVYRDFRRELGKSLFKISAMVTSCLAMLSLSYYVYTSFNGLTKDLCLHICFLAAVVVRTIRINCQGTLLE